MTGMASLVENERANEYVRSAALKGLVTLVACGKRSRDEVVAVVRQFVVPDMKRIFFCLAQALRFGIAG